MALSLLLYAVFQEVSWPAAIRQGQAVLPSGCCRDQRELAHDMKARSTISEAKSMVWVIGALVYLSFAIGESHYIAMQQRSPHAKATNLPHWRDVL